MSLCYWEDKISWHVTLATTVLFVNRNLRIMTILSSAPIAAPPTTGPAGRRSAPACTSPSMRPGLNGNPKLARVRPKPLMRRPAPTVAPTTPPARCGVAIAAAAAQSRRGSLRRGSAKTAGSGSHLRPQPRRCKPWAVPPAMTALPPAPTSTPTPQARTASSGGRSAPRTPLRASRPRTGPPLWVAARCTT